MCCNLTQFNVISIIYLQNSDFQTKLARYICNPSWLCQLRISNIISITNQIYLRKICIRINFYIYSSKYVNPHMTLDRYLITLIVLRFMPADGLRGSLFKRFLCIRLWKYIFIWLYVIYTSITYIILFIQPFLNETIFVKTVLSPTLPGRSVDE